MKKIEQKFWTKKSEKENFHSKVQKNYLQRKEAKLMI